MPQAAETDVLDPPTELDEDPPADPPSSETLPDEDPPEDPPADEEEVVITLGEDPPPSEEDENQRAPEWVRELRKTNREKDRRIRELEAQLKAPQAAETAADPGTKPTLDSCGYDEAKFEAELSAWHERKRKAEEQQTEQRRKAEAEQAAWQATLDAYGKEKSALKVKDFEDAEDVVKEHLSTTQQGVILHGAEKRAQLVYALGKSPSKLKELAAIADPVKFAFAIAKLETQLKVTPKKSAPLPERQLHGSSPGGAAVENQLERLRAEAAKTGDFSKVHAFKRQQRQRAGGK